MLTYQDYEKSNSKTKFYLDAIEEYRGSEQYYNAYVAQTYYGRKNSAIINRMTFLQKWGTIKDSKIKFFKIRSGFFQKSVKQLSQYLLGNGVTLDQQYKDMLGDKFDKSLQRMGMQALIDGVNWGFWNVDRLMVYRATEFFSIFDELTGDTKIGIRFWQIDADKPLYLEVYKDDGIHKYVLNKNSNDLDELHEDGKPYPIPYKQKVYQDELVTNVVDTENYPNIPVFPLYANDLRSSELTTGLKEDIDAYDFINSDLADGVTLVDGVYWALKNYGGNDASELVQEIQAIKAAVTDDNTTAEGKSLEIPYQAKKTALELLEKRMYKETMTLNTEELTGGGLTNVAIKVAMTDLDLKADVFEWQCGEFVSRILELIGITGVEPKFKRRTIQNDTEMVTNIYTMRADLDHRTALELNPLIADDQVDEILDRFDEEQMGTNEEPLGGEDMELKEEDPEMDSLEGGL